MNASSAKRRKLDLDPDSSGASGVAKGKKKATTTNKDTDKDVLRAREVMLYGAAVRSASGPGRHRDTELDMDFGFGDGTRDGVFKIPVVPARAKLTGKARVKEADVFGSNDTGGRGVKRKGRWKGEGEEEREAEADQEVGEVEKANRVVRISLCDFTSIPSILSLLLGFGS